MIGTDVRSPDGLRGSSVEDVAFKTDPLLPVLELSAGLRPMLSEASALRLQVLVSVPDKSAPAKMTRLGYRVDAEYFYPASAVKLGAAISALEKISTLRAQSGTTELGADTPLRIYPASGAKAEDRDASNLKGGRITIGHEIRKALLVSNNEAFNRLFDFVGYDDINTQLRTRGFDSVRLRHFVGWAGGDARANSRMQLRTESGLSVEVPERRSRAVLPETELTGLKVGDAYYDGKGRLVSEPMPFEEKNRISLRDLQDMLVSVVRPELLPDRKLHLNRRERDFLVEVLGKLPSESTNPIYDARSQPDEMHRPLLFGVRRALPSHRIRSFGKGGQAYGFVVQNSYLVDETTGKSAFVAATIHVNSDGTMNDDQYEYTEVAKPFIDALGELIARRYLQ